VIGLPISPRAGEQCFVAQARLYKSKTNAGSELSFHLGTSHSTDCLRLVFAEIEHFRGNSLFVRGSAALTGYETRPAEDRRLPFDKPMPALTDRNSPGEDTLFYTL